MSNVLIGIIGAILFIGLALAGAFILGGDFRTASASSQATTLLSQMRQTADAAGMYRLRTGSAYVPATEANFLIPRFLKAAPSSPTPAARSASGDELYHYSPHFNRWQVEYDYGEASPNQTGRYPAKPADFVTSLVGRVGDQQAKAVCQSIVDATSRDPMPDEDLVNGGSGYDPGNPLPGSAGCWETYLLVNSAADYEKAYVAWVRL